jgi:predicted NUDIX family phosphoesterase
LKQSLLGAVEEVLAACGRPLSAKAIVKELASRGKRSPGGATPWKSVGARLAVDIRSNSESRFIRVGRGLYALSAWKDVTPVEVPRRRINPLDEDILVVDTNVFAQLKAGRCAGSLYDIHYRDLLAASRPLHRMKAEDDESLIQLIPSFLVFEDDRVLSFKRTKKTPEQRLHDTFSIVFGGHLQAEDNPALFADDDDEVERFLFRELHEELSFEPPFRRSRYIGVLYLEGSAFERQHAGVVFAVELSPGTIVTSLEPGFQSTLRLLPWNEISTSPVMDDRWSAACIAHIQEAE